MSSDQQPSAPTSTPGPAHRSVGLERTEHGRYRAHNARGGSLDVGTGEDTDFTPVELLLAAIAGCTAVDVDMVTTRRAEPTTFRVTAGAEKVNDDQGHHLGPVTVRFEVTFPEGPQGDAARAALPRAVEASHERLCTVSRTVMLPTQVTSVITPVTSSGTPGTASPGPSQQPPAEG